jgi:D-sedoheptulose 7-phosphate isomerase
MSHSKKFFEKAREVIDKFDFSKINNVANELAKIRDNEGRIFFIGVGGSSGNCSHAVNDFRKLCEIECYSPSDNQSELTARINDEGWDTCYSEWLKVSKLNKKDCLFIMSVGGGDLEKNISVNIVNSIKLAQKISCKILGIVGKEDGFAAKNSDDIIVVPQVDKKLITPLTESFQAIIWHCLVSDPKLQKKNTKW